MRKQSDAKTDPSAASIDAPRADGDSRRRSTPWTPQTPTDADGRETHDGVRRERFPTTRRRESGRATTRTRSSARER
jgi:hypothetical protein